MFNTKYDALRKKIHYMISTSKEQHYVLFNKIKKEIEISYKNENWTFFLLCGIIFDEGLIGINFRTFLKFISDEDKVISKSEIERSLKFLGYNKKLPNDSLNIKDPNIYERVNNRDWSFFKNHIYNNDTDDESFSRLCEIFIPAI